MALYEITAENLHKLDETSFDVAGVRERYNLQRHSLPYRKFQTVRHFAFALELRRAKSAA